MMLNRILGGLLAALIAVTCLPTELSAKNVILEKGRKAHCKTHKKKHHSSKSCNDLPKPCPNPVLDLSMQNCISCSENKKDRYLTFKINDTCLDHKKMCKGFKKYRVGDFPSIIDPSQLVLIQDPAF